MHKMTEYLKNPWKIFASLAYKGFFKTMDDETYLKCMYRAMMGKKLNLKTPRTFNEKLQWLKLYDRKSIYSTMVDKYEVKLYAQNLIGEEYIIPNIGVWNSTEEIKPDELPDKFVLKSTHDSGGVVICKNKSTFDLDGAKKRLAACLERSYYWAGREWPYKNVKPRIIAEAYLDVIESSELVEYKIFCFNGTPKLFLVCKGEGHGGDRTNDFYDMNFKHISVTITYPNAREICQKPKEYDELVTLARKLSKGIPQLRVDFYVANGKIYLGELTFFHDSGFCHFHPDQYDLEFGKLIDLPRN